MVRNVYHRLPSSKTRPRRAGYLERWYPRTGTVTREHQQGKEKVDMKIERVESFLMGNRWLFVEITTDTGIVGLGEAGLWGYPAAAEAVIAQWRPYLIGKDPLQIEHHWQYLYRNAHFRGAAIGGALGGIDIALWDIAGKHYGAPCYALMGGKCRDRVRLYMHIGGDSLDDFLIDGRRAVDDGFTALRFVPFKDDYPSRRFSDVMAESVARVGALRETVGNGVDLCVEIHRRMSPMEAITLGRELAQFRPFFLEDPIIPDSVQSMADVQRQCAIPIATGERLHTIFEFRELLQASGCQFIRPDVCIAGGLTQSKKIATLAEAYHIGVIPHNPLSPVSTAACVQLDACIPNFTLQEYTGEDKPPKSLLLKEPLTLERGYLIIPDRPGIGVALNHDTVASNPFTHREIATPLHEDGSVADW